MINESNVVFLKEGRYCDILVNLVVLLLEFGGEKSDYLE